MSSSRSGSRIRLLATDLSTNPVCSHGPTLLFQNLINDKKYFSCSSCRTRKECPFYLGFDDWLKTKDKNKTFGTNGTKNEKKYVFDKSLKQSKFKLKFCRNCSVVVTSDQQLSQHSTHELMNGISGEQLSKPTKLLKRLTENRFCAQYMFSDQTIEFSINEIILKNQFKSVISIGCPSIHEYIETQTERLEIRSILLDIDDRYKQFYSSKQFLKYNLFNNYFFDGLEDQNTFKQFIRDSPKESIIVLMDPPFGGLIEAMAKTIETISEIWREEHRKDTDITDNNELIPIVLFFPYFNENRIKTTIPVLSMSDYMVDYANHKKFQSSGSGRKFGSPVRIYTNIELSSIVLPESKGYYYCSDCLKYVSENNKHCFECSDCTARDGSVYKHCYQCKRCVKNSWNHCNRCRVCHLLDRHFETSDKRKSVKNFSKTNKKNKQ